MKLSKVIEILNDNFQPPTRLPSSDLRDAIQVSIEAVKEVIKARYGDPALDGELLPGETPESEGE
uniref:Uncharacterized protein n=1 Tax=viral metagenome TaxID=1070528 RepID=A0A6M3M2D8_9ZZZZ